jgi:transcriptional regulator with XRE-family HTH domain
MPSKRDLIKAQRRGDPLVPIVGVRVKAALEYAGVSQQAVAARANVTRQAIGDIVAGKREKCRQSLRRVIAELCGRPITISYLAGKKELALPSVLWPPSGPRPDLVLPDEVHQHRPGDLPPFAQLTSSTLGADIEAMPGQEWSIGNHVPIPRVGNAIRWLLDLAFWREFVMSGQARADSGIAFQQDADEFAKHMAAAIRVLLRPALERRSRLRRFILRRLALVLDSVASENLEMYLALHSGRFADAVILDHVSGRLPSERPALRTMLEEQRDAARARGLSEVQVADFLLHLWRKPTGFDDGSVN